MPGVGFIRVKLLQADGGPGGPPLSDPFLAVNIKEAVEIPGKCPQLTPSLVRGWGEALALRLCSFWAGVTCCWYRGRSRVIFLGTC